MEVVEKVKVLGRGNVIIVDPCNYDCNFIVGDHVNIHDTEFGVSGVEIAPFTNKIGLVLYPNDKVSKIEIGDKVYKV